MRSKLLFAAKRSTSSKLFRDVSKTSRDIRPNWRIWKDKVSSWVSRKSNSIQKSLKSVRRLSTRKSKSRTLKKTFQKLPLQFKKLRMQSANRRKWFWSNKVRLFNQRLWSTPLTQGLKTSPKEDRIMPKAAKKQRLCVTDFKRVLLINKLECHERLTETTRSTWFS